jgi:hypothetical protein
VPAHHSKKDCKEAKFLQEGLKASELCESELIGNYSILSASGFCRQSSPTFEFCADPLIFVQAVPNLYFCAKPTKTGLEILKTRYILA